MDKKNRYDRLFSFYGVPLIFLIAGAFALNQYIQDSERLTVHYVPVEGTLSSFFEVEKQYGELFIHRDHYLHFRLAEYDAEFDLGLIKNHLDSVELARHSAVGEQVTALITSTDSLSLNSTDTIYVFKLKTADGAEIKNDYRLAQSLNLRFTRNASGFIAAACLFLAVAIHLRNRRRWKPVYDS